MSDHYMAPISRATSAFETMKQIQAECYKIGIPLKTRHREVAPNQYEFAPMFGNVINQVDQNLMVMQIIEEVASENGMAALLNEKPFAGINGSGKHNNWSIGTSDGVNLLNPQQLNKALHIVCDTSSLQSMTPFDEEDSETSIDLLRLYRLISAVDGHLPRAPFGPQAGGGRRQIWWCRTVRLLV